MNIVTITQMIEELTKAKLEFGGNTEIGLKDPDTSCHMKISGIRKSNNVPNRLLVTGSGYADEDLL